MTKPIEGQQGPGQTDFDDALIFEIESSQPVSDLFPQNEANQRADAGGFTRASTPKHLSTEQRKLDDGMWHQVHIFQVEVAR